MKTFREFLSEDAVKAQKAWQDWMNANPQEFTKGGRFYERGSSGKTTAAAKEFMKGYMKTGKPPAGFEVKSTKVPGQDVRSGSQSRAQTPPKQPTGTSQTPPKATQAPPKQQPKTSTPPPPKAEPKATQAPPKQPSGSTPPPPKPPTNNAPVSSAKPTAAAPTGPGLRSRLGGVVGPAANVAGAAIDYKERRDAGQSRQRAAGGAASQLAGYAAAAKFGAMVPGPPIVKGAAAIGAGLVGAEKAGQAYDWAADKTRPARQAVGRTIGFDKFQQKQAAFKPGSGLSGLARAQQTVDTRGARQVAARTGAYGTKQGSALTGAGGPTTVNRQAGTLTSGGKTAKLSSTQLVRDPKTGQQRVGDLAYKGGKAVYLARPSIQSRDTSLAARVGRALNIGSYSRTAQAQAAKQEYRTALRGTQQYQRQLGITPQAATAQKLPGRGVGPAKVGPKIVGPKKVGTGIKPSPSAIVRPV